MSLENRVEIALLGNHPFEKRADGKLKGQTGVVCISPEYGYAVSFGSRGHLDLKYQYVSRKRLEKGLQPFTNSQAAEESAVFQKSFVDLVVEEGTIFIRPNPDKPEGIEMSIKADEILVEALGNAEPKVPKQKIKYLGVLDSRIRDAIRTRGEFWRIAALPRSKEEITQAIEKSRTTISTKAAYYYSKETAERILTYTEFDELDSLQTDELAKALEEIKVYSAKDNDLGNKDVTFFMADPLLFSFTDFQGIDFTRLSTECLMAQYRAVKEKFRTAIDVVEFRNDDIDNSLWRKMMFSELIGKNETVVTDEVLLGLCPEYYMHIKWLPGARFENGRPVFDSIFDEKDADPIDSELAGFCDDIAQNIISNYYEEYYEQGPIEYINIGKIVESASKRTNKPGRRDVYIVAMKLANEKEEQVSIIRMQKYGFQEHYQEELGNYYETEERRILAAKARTEEYIDYFKDRHDGCTMLRMNLLKFTENHVTENFRGMPIRSTYFERKYIHGKATDKIPATRYESSEFSLRLARLLGIAGARNIIVGRGLPFEKSDKKGMAKEAIFDDGDEILIEKDGIPAELVIAGHVGSFADYKTAQLETFAYDYAKPVLNRAQHLADSHAFAKIYVSSFVSEFKSIQDEYRRKQKEYQGRFRFRRYDTEGSFAYRWKKILERLGTSDADSIGAAIMSEIQRGFEQGKRVCA